MFDDLMRHRREFARAIENHQYERSPTGILFPKQGLHVGGVFQSFLNGEGAQLDDNLIPTEGLNHILDVVGKGAAQVTTWYVSLFSGNYTPVAGITGASYVADATEYTDHDEGARVAWVEGAISAGSVSNSASKADFTIAAGVVNDVLYGAALLQASAHGATTGKILAISRFSSSRTVNATDVLSVQYTLTITSA